MAGVSSPELIAWINAELQRRDITGAEASRRAGVNVGAISEIVNGTAPGLEVSKALARFFGVSAEYVLRLAGHVEDRTTGPLASIPRLQDFAYRVSRLPPERQRRIMDAALLLLEIGESVEDVNEREVLSPPARVE